MSSVIPGIHLAGVDGHRQDVGSWGDRAVVVIREGTGRVVGHVEVEHIAAVPELLDVYVPTEPVRFLAARGVLEEDAKLALANARLEQSQRFQPTRRVAHHEVEPADTLGPALVPARGHDDDDVAFRIWRERQLI